MSFVAITAATALWIPNVHRLFEPRLDECIQPNGISSMARALANRHLALWADPERRRRELDRMRHSNAEWDFMGRTYLVLSLANMALREPSRQTEYLQVLDRVIDETLHLERERGMYFFLMDYARARPFVGKPARSLFIDGEIALMLGARRLVRERTDYGALERARIQQMVRAMRAGAVLSAESYPDECWTFCNAVALAAIRTGDVLDGTNHSALLRDWVATAKRKLVDPGTRLLPSSYTLDGSVLDGPEGSSIWMVAHCLQVVDPEFAADQYRRARAELQRGALGFGWAAEWPRSHRGPDDIDSGPVIPSLDISPGSSGLAILGAAAFNDRSYLTSLLTTLNAGAFPRSSNARSATARVIRSGMRFFSMPSSRDRSGKRSRQGDSDDPQAIG